MEGGKKRINRNIRTRRNERGKEACAMGRRKRGKEVNERRRKRRMHRGRKFSGNLFLREESMLKGKGVDLGSGAGIYMNLFFVSPTHTFPCFYFSFCGYPFIYLSVYLNIYLSIDVSVYLSLLR